MKTCLCCVQLRTLVDFHEIKRVTILHADSEATQNVEIFVSRSHDDEQQSQVGLDL